MTNEEILELIQKPENENLEFKAALMPSNNLAKLISSFANTSGGHIIFGISEKSNQQRELTGIKTDVPARSIVNKAISLLNPTPNVSQFSHLIDEKLIYIVSVEKSDEQVTTGNGLVFKRIGDQTRLLTPEEVINFQPVQLEIVTLNHKIDNLRNNGTSSKKDYFDHCKSLLAIIESTQNILFPSGINCPTQVSEGKVLTKLVYASFLDIFEKYLSDLLYEIYLAKPETLKSESKTISTKDVLDCSDIEEFVQKIAKEKVEKLNKGSVKEFLEKNQQIKCLNIFDDSNIQAIEGIFEIRHLFTHKNGVIDTKFINKTGTTQNEGEIFEINIKKLLEDLEFVVDLCEKVDNAAIPKFSLSIN